MPQTDAAAVDEIKPLSTYWGEPIWNQRLMALRVAEKLNWLVFMFPNDPHKTAPSDLSYTVLLCESAVPLNIHDPAKSCAIRVWEADEVLPMIHAFGIAHGVPHLTAYREDVA